MAVKPWGPPGPPGPPRPPRSPTADSTIYPTRPDRANVRRTWTTHHYNISHSSLRGMEIAVPPTKDFPPPAGTMVYEKKPLPAVPPQGRRSTASSFGREINDAFHTPERSMENIRQEFRDWATEAAEIAVLLDQTIKPVRASRRHPEIQLPPINTFPATPPSEIVSPQPRQSVPKILQLTGLPNPLASPSSTTPSGYNPQHKIRQLMGMDIDSDDYQWAPVPPVSPLTPTSSIYSQDGLDTTISEPDESMCTGWKDEEGYASDSGEGTRRVSWVDHASTGLQSLHINRARKTSIASTHFHAEQLGAVEPETPNHARVLSGLFVRFQDAPKPKAKKEPKRESKNGSKKESKEDSKEEPKDESKKESKKDSKEPNESKEPKKGRHQPTISSSSVDYHISAAEIAYATNTSKRKGHSSQPSASSIGSIFTQSSSSSVYSTPSSLDQGDTFSNRTHDSPLRSPPPPPLSTAASPTPGVVPSAAGSPPKTPYPYPLKSVFDVSDDEDEASPSGSEPDIPSRRRSMMDRVFKGRHRSRGSGGSGGGSKGSTSWASSSPRSDPHSAVPDTRPAVSVTSAARGAPALPQLSPSRQRSVVRKERPLAAVTSPLPLASFGGMAGLAHRKGDLMEQARAAIGGRHKDVRKHEDLMRGIYGLTDDTPRRVKVSPPVPPRPLSIVAEGDKFTGNWL